MQTFNKPGICNGCGNSRVIVNAKYGFCGVCNSERTKANRKPAKPLNPGKSIKKAQKRPNQKSDKKRIREEALSETKKLISETRPHICTGCGRSGNLSFSHIIAVSNRPDLESNPRNIVFDCLTVGRVNPRGRNGNDYRGCHEIFENGTKEDREKLLNWPERLEIIKELDLNYYHLLESKNRI